MSRHRGLTEQPVGSNTDKHRDGIRHAQIQCAGGGNWLIGCPWCGVWVWAALHYAGVRNLSSRLASVTFIEDDARAQRGPFRGWTQDKSKVLRGDLVVLFGRGVHVEMVRQVHSTYLVTDGGNTSPGVAGSQSNGGGSYRRKRPLSAVHGFALVDFPGS